MEQNELQRVLEAILFAAGEPVEVSRLAATLECDEADIIKAADTLADQLSFDRRGIRILRLENAYQMASSGEMADFITKTLETRKPPKLSASQLESLTIVGAIYLCITFPLSKLVGWFEKKMANPNSYKKHNRKRAFMAGGKVSEQ